MGRRPAGPPAAGAAGGGLRLHQEIYDGRGTGVVDAGARTHRTSYIPHGFVADWSGDGAGHAT